MILLYIGLEILSEAVSYYITEELNGDYSLINIWECGQLKRDNFDIKILNSIGKYAGVL